ncbi:hypothetical protein NEPAR04_0599 [Nematocida parisii]|nr:hypothetical protein NEPAR03_0260 [Nematocida parisii]KAI5126750.1 hypothetical protein NEPAR08_0602 [Nematocida parisii]KAI5140938.1 hypothetical protein NEPAR04_0599 [Nematocida parisii]
MAYDTTGCYVQRKISEKLILVIVCMTIAIIAHLAFTVIVYFVDKNKDVSNLKTGVELGIIVQHNIILIYALIIIQGLLERDIFQVFLATFVTTVVNALYVAVSFMLKFEGPQVLYMSNLFFIVICGIILLYIICFTGELQADIGWFYYKSYGPTYNVQMALEKSTYTFFKINIQLFVSSIIRKYYLVVDVGFFYIETALYAAIIILNILERAFKVVSLLIRLSIISIICVLLSYNIIQLSDDSIINKDYTLYKNDTTDYYTLYEQMTLGVQAAMLGGYVLLLIVLTLNQTIGWASKEEIDQKGKKRISI